METDKKRERLRYRSWHRGTREMDLLLGSFADAHLPAFTPEQLNMYEVILDMSDPDMYDWITGQKPVPQVYQSEVMNLIVTHQFKRGA